MGIEDGISENDMYDYANIIVGKISENEVVMDQRVVISKNKQCSSNSLSQSIIPLLGV